MINYFCMFAFVIGSTLVSNASFAQTKEGDVQATENQEGETDENAKAEALARKQMGETFPKITTFYKNPTQEVFSSISNVIETNNDFIMKTSEKSGVHFVLATFIARASSKNEFEISGEGEILKLAKDIATNNQENDVAKAINDNENVTPRKLDLWWTSFYATGETDYLDRILAQLNSEDPLLQELAAWSFKSNCKARPDVKSFAKKAIEDEKYTKHKEFLEKCITPWRSKYLREADDSKK